MLAKLGLCKAEGGVARRVLGVLDVPEAGEFELSELHHEKSERTSPREQVIIFINHMPTLEQEGSIIFFDVI